MELTDDDVLEILKLFEQSKFDFLQLEQGERKITVSKGGYVPAGAGGAGAGISSAASSAAAAALSPSPMSAPLPQPAAKSAASSSPDGLVAVTAPMVGKFY